MKHHAKLLRIAILGAVFALPTTRFATADIYNFLDTDKIAALASETSGESAKRNLDQITQYHRMRASSEFRAASEHILGQLRSYGYDTAEILEYPADGRTMFGTQKSRPAWEVEFAELWELGSKGEKLRRLANWDAQPLTVAQDSMSGHVTAALVDIGAGTSDADYAGKDLTGKIVLTSSQPETVADKAVGELGAAGIISYAQNQVTAWWKDDDSLIRWGHLDTFSDVKTFGFMISLKEARALQSRLKAGEEIVLRADIDAGHEESVYSLVTALIPGSDPAVTDEEIIYTCHLDHPRPGANDNASGCVAILEVARTLKKLIDEGRLPAPRRSIRFLWPAEIEGSIIYLAADPNRAANTRYNIHLDMVGGGPETKATFRISTGPASVANFGSDIAHAIGNFVNAQSQAFADGQNPPYPLNAPEGGKEPLHAIYEALNMGSDHQVFNAGTWGIPGIYLHDWPDRYIHTTGDTAARIDPTKLKRASFIAAAQGIVMASFDHTDVDATTHEMQVGAIQRASALIDETSNLSDFDAGVLRRVHWAYERALADSLGEWSGHDGADQAAFILRLENAISGTQAATPATGGAATIYTRNPAIPGPMMGFGYNYFYAHSDINPALAHRGIPYTYEALNLVNGERSVAEIRDWLSAQLGPVPVSEVEDYLSALEAIRILIKKD